MGASQATCVYSIVATKASKIRFHQGSGSLNFRVASRVSQFNKGHDIRPDSKETEIKEVKMQYNICEKGITKTKMKESSSNKQKCRGKKRRMKLKKSKAWLQNLMTYLNTCISDV